MLRATSASRDAPTIGLKNTHARAMVVIESERPTTDANSSAAKLTALASSVPTSGIHATRPIMGVNSR